MLLIPDISWVFVRDCVRNDVFAESLKAELVPNLQAALDIPLDALIIANPSSLHAEFVLSALQFGLPMYIEKPVAISLLQIESLQQCLSAASKVPVTQVGCNLRFLPSLQRLKQLICAGVIGRVVRASFDAGQWLPDWRPQQDHRESYSADPARGGGVLFDLIHEIDAAYWILGELTPLACAVENVPRLEIKSESVATALLRAHSGALVQIGLDYVSRSPLRRYQFVGETGTLVWDLSAKVLSLHTADRSQILDSGDSGFDVSSTYYSAMKAFVESLLTQQQQVHPLSEGLAVSAITVGLKRMALVQC
ncbi:possible oxidoreductase, GFO/Idh/MocA family protein [Parasynechococcus marenigrum WH 8102]|uniref:Possible oxidoreductase, GFO/Idh/MocA family protein n=2 Tax=Parasynechococcus TaxID=2881427 RepID=Q7U916_PARMW|nr:possible oxidoreductase, GFO/Idh/MocA family protein [Parasynechococcus marenigrum WH 8102]